MSNEYVVEEITDTDFQNTQLGRQMEVQVANYLEENPDDQALQFFFNESTVNV